VDMAALTAAVRGAPEVAVAMGDMGAEMGWGLVEMARIKLDFNGYPATIPRKRIWAPASRLHARRPVELPPWRIAVSTTSA
jgi:hypothetical protein